MIANASGVAPWSFCTATSFLPLTLSNSALHSLRSPLHAARWSRLFSWASRHCTTSSFGLGETWPGAEGSESATFLRKSPTTSSG